MGDLDYVIQRTWLNNLDADTLQLLRSNLESVQIQQGEVLFKQGEPGDCMYVITHGMLDVLVQDAEGEKWLVALRGRGDFIGEVALLTGQNRTATARAAEESELWKLDKGHFDAICVLDRDLLRQLSSYVGPKLQMIELVSVLSGLFGVLDMATLLELEARLIWKHMQAGDVISFLAEPQGSMYIIVNGRLRVDLVTAEGQQSELGQIGRGDTVGELNLLTGENREVVLTALRDTDLVRISQDIIESLLERKPSSVLRFVRRTATRIQSAGQAAQEARFSATSFALLPLSEGITANDIASPLSAALSRFGACLHLSSERFDRQYGREGAAQTEESDPTNISVLHWLSVQEHTNEFVIYECDPGWTSWTQRCLRQADRIVLIGQAESSPTLRDLERAAADGYSVERELVLLHPSSTSIPSGTRAWLEPRSLRAFHHVRYGDRDDIGRLARRLIGKEVALVLSGGGARGFAHAGVFRALEEAGIPIDLIGGTSMGALIGCSLAQGDNFERILSFAQEYGSPSKLFDFTLPISSFLASFKLTRMLRGVFGEKDLEDLWRPFFCVSADLTKARPVIHTKGRAWEAVRGSLAIPGIFAPYLHQGSVVVDGGVLNNNPIDVMREAYPGAWILGVTVSPPHEMSEAYHFEAGISGWRVLLNRLNPLSAKKKVPTIFSTMTRSLEVSGIHQLTTVRDQADIVIQPDATGWNFMDFRPAAEIAEAGYQAAATQMDGIMAKFRDRYPLTH